jgi:hypothetical protein
LHASKDSFDSSLDSTFALTSLNSIPEVTALKADRSSPQAKGAVITWNAIAVDPDGDEIAYKFLANENEVREWSSSNSWVWDTSSTTPGEYRIKVLARDGNHASEDSFDSSMDAVFSLISEIDQQIDQLMKKRSAEASQQEDYQSSDIRVASGNGTNSNVVLGKSNSTAGQEKAVTPRKLGG